MSSLSASEEEIRLEEELIKLIENLDKNINTLKKLRQRSKRQLTKLWIKQAFQQFNEESTDTESEEDYPSAPNEVSTME